MPLDSKSTSLTLRPLDILLLVKLIVSSRDETPRQQDIALSLHISQASVSQSLKRLYKCKLIDSNGQIVPAAAEEFIVHGLKYMLPAEIGGLTRGVSTSHGAPPLNKTIRGGGSEQYVWPSADGKVRGQALEPIHESVVMAAKSDEKFYEFFALIDALRVGRVREMETAKKELHSRIWKP